MTISTLSSASIQLQLSLEVQMDMKLSVHGDVAPPSQQLFTTSILKHDPRLIHSKPSTFS